MPAIAWIDGRFVPIGEARVSIEDRGFQFGDGVYDVARTRDGRPLLLDRHVDRFLGSARKIEIDVGLAAEEIAAILREAHRLSGFPDALLYIQATRGAAPRAHVFPSGVRATVVVTVRPIDRDLARERAEGVPVITHEDIRWGRCDVKSICLLPNVMLKERARREGAFETILFDRSNRLTEGTSCNVLVVKGGRVATAPLSPAILPGVTRTVLLEAAREAGVPVDEAAPARADVDAADEVLLTSTTADVLPVVRIDGRPVGTGRPGSLARRLLELLESRLSG